LTTSVKRSMVGGVNDGDKNLHQHPNLRRLFSLLVLYSSERLGSQSCASSLKKPSKLVVESNVLKREREHIQIFVVAPMSLDVISIGRT
jgi:hypothetical protein